MKILQAITLSALLLLNISKVCSQEDKKTKDFFNSGGYISEGYALDRNQVRFNQSSDFVFHHIPNGNLICITSKQFRAHAFSRHYNCILSKDSNFIAYVSVPPIFCGDKDSIYADFSFKTGFMIEMNQLDAIEQQLHAFPHNLYPTFKADPVDFLRQVFYKRVPRKQGRRAEAPALRKGSSGTADGRAVRQDVRPSAAAA